VYGELVAGGERRVARISLVIVKLVDVPVYVGDSLDNHVDELYQAAHLAQDAEAEGDGVLLVVVQFFFGIEGSADVGVYGIVPVADGVAVAELVRHFLVVLVDVLDKIVQIALDAAPAYRRAAHLLDVQGGFVVGTGDERAFDVLEVVGVEFYAYPVQYVVYFVFNLHRLPLISFVIRSYEWIIKNCA